MNEGPRAVHRRPKFISDFRENISPLLLIFALALHAFSQRSTGGRDLVPHDFLAKTPPRGCTRGPVLATQAEWGAVL